MRPLGRFRSQRLASLLSVPRPSSEVAAAAAVGATTQQQHSQCYSAPTQGYRDTLINEGVTHPHVFLRVALWLPFRGYLSSTGCRPLNSTAHQIAAYRTAHRSVTCILLAKRTSHSFAADISEDSTAAYSSAHSLAAHSTSAHRGAAHSTAAGYSNTVPRRRSSTITAHSAAPSTAAYSTTRNLAAHNTGHNLPAHSTATAYSNTVLQRRSSTMAVQLPRLSGPVKVLFCGDEFPAAYDLSAAILRRDPQVTAEWCPREQVPERIKECHVVVPRMTRLTADILAGAKELKLIVQFGVGLEGVDIPAATARGIAVARIPSALTGNAASCAEHCIYLLLGLLRQQHVMAASVRERKLGQPLGQTLQGRTVLICGYGAIGRELAVRLQPFGVRILGVRRAWNGISSTQGPNHESTRHHVPSPLHVAAGLDSLPRLLPEADAVVMCNQLSDETRGMVNASFLASCKKGVHIINIARGGLLDYDSVLSALEQGHIGGLGLDVTWHEPCDPADPIFRHPNVIVTPHVGGVTDVSYQTMAQIINDTVTDLRQGAPLHLVEVVNRKELGLTPVPVSEGA